MSTLRRSARGKEPAYVPEWLDPLSLSSHAAVPRKDWCGTPFPLGPQHVDTGAELTGYCTKRRGCCKAGLHHGMHWGAVPLFKEEQVLRVRKPGITSRWCAAVICEVIHYNPKGARCRNAFFTRQYNVKFLEDSEIREEYSAEELNSIIYDHNRALESVYEKDIEALPDMQNIEAEIDDVAGLQPYRARELIENTGGACLLVGHVTPLERARVLGDADMVKLGSAAHIFLHHSFVRVHESIRTTEARAELKRFPKEVRRSLVQALRVRLLCARAPADAWEAVLYVIITPEGWGGRRE